uniref:Uncharacterized protein n=1 Tax=Anguilla anguilla TaxID=7936 RepID=A0A0E9SNA0_ANGAN
MVLTHCKLSTPGYTAKCCLSWFASMVLAATVMLASQPTQDAANI